MVLIKNPYLGTHNSFAFQFLFSVYCYENPNFLFGTDLEQKRKSSRFILAPIEASREILRSVYLSLGLILYFSLILCCYYYYFGLIVWFLNSS